ncbi:MAG TPA: hypothetical protein VM661_00830 [Candidatus Sulfotelmatobacter sp.]|jgi:hypothetical protein|nr:hypothetical protein [Candidatus Sulfotelmatobacter sp.]
MIAQSTTEIQALATLKAARVVAEDIEALRNALKEDGLSQRKRQKLKDDLLEAAERLCNLLDLLLSWLSMVSESIRQPLSAGIQDMRDRLLSTGVKLIGDKAQRLLDHANGVLKSGFPLGLSFRVNEAASSLNSTVEALGGFESMPDDVKELLYQLGDMVEHLRHLEESFAFSQEFVDIETPLFDAAGNLIEPPVSDATEQTPKQP